MSSAKAMTYPRFNKVSRTCAAMKPLPPVSKTRVILSRSQGDLIRGVGRGDRG